ncbi:unnamed protein product [Amoebophrya sp. A120]|nr:unnamed protein product [Amoebophrya sp. A120]|eukprot:GSA120T00002087001.1
MADSSKKDQDLTKRVLLAGDANANFTTLFDTVGKQQARVGDFDLLLACGSFLGEDITEENQQYLLGLKQPNIPTYFVDSDSERFIEGFAAGKEFGAAASSTGTSASSSSSSTSSSLPQATKRLVFLGSHGVKTIQGGLRVAYLSGRYNAVYYEDESVPFHGACYTRLAVEQLKRQSKIADEFGQTGVDVLLCSEWPKGWQNKVYDQVPNLQDVEPVGEGDIESSAISDLVAALAPRYVVCAKGNTFYQRPPFQTLKAQHVSRLIALGKVGAKGKDKKWLHALQLRPLRAMTADELRTKPDNTTPFPFQNLAGDSLQGLQRLQHNVSSGDGGQKRGRDEDDQPEGVELFLSNLTAGLSENNLRSALERALGGGSLLRLKVMVNERTGECKGFGFATVVSKELAEKALELELEAGGRTVKISYKRQREHDDLQKKEQVLLAKKKVGKKIVVEPHADCWFCLANPKFQRHMLVAVNPHLYVATAKGGINEGNMILCPVKHMPNYLSIFNFTEYEQLRDSIETYISAIRKMFLDPRTNRDPCDMVVWERWIPTKMAHMQVQLLPIPRSRYVNWSRTLDLFAEQNGLEFERLGSVIIDPETGRQPEGADQDGTSTHVVDPYGDAKPPSTALPKLLSQNANRFFANEPERNLQSLLQMTYLYLELPGDNTAKGKKIDRYVCYGPGRIPMNFARDVICTGLDCMDRSDWRDCQLDGPREKEIAQALKSKLDKYLPAGAAK